MHAYTHTLPHTHTRTLSLSLTNTHTLSLSHTHTSTASSGEAWWCRMKARGRYAPMGIAATVGAPDKYIYIYIILIHGGPKWEDTVKIASNGNRCTRWRA